MALWTGVQPRQRRRDSSGVSVERGTGRAAGRLHAPSADQPMGAVERPRPGRAGCPLPWWV